MLTIAKNAIRKVFASRGYEIRRTDGFPRLDFPFEVLVCVLLRELAREPDFYFVQVGANDGVLNDGLNRLIRAHDLRGTLVEPLPDVFTRLRENYRDQPQLAFANCAIGLEDSKVEIHRFRSDAPVPEAFFHGLARLDGDYIRRRAEGVGLSSYVERVSVPMLSFATFQKTHGVPRVDLLYVDTEGHDKSVIESAFHAQVFPRVIQYEWSEMNLQERHELKMLLLAKGYRFIDVGPDTVCLRVEERNED